MTFIRMHVNAGERKHKLMQSCFAFRWALKFKFNFDLWIRIMWNHLTNRRSILEIDRYIGSPILTVKKKIKFKFKKKKLYYLSHTIIQSITSSEMCSLYLTHPRTHTLGAVNTHTHTHTWSSGHCSLSGWSSGNAPARPPHVTLYKIHLFETCETILTFTIEPLFRQ